AIGLTPVSALTSSTDASLPVSGLGLDFTRTYGGDLVQRYQMGPFGRGWSAPWQISLQVQSDGTVVIRDSADSMRIFQPDSRHSGQYFAQSGDPGILVKGSDGAYELTETDGQVTRFRADQTLEYVEDANGNRVTAGFTGGRLTSLTHSSGASLSISYNPAGLISSLTSFASPTDTLGRTTTYLYDNTNSLLLSATGPLGTTLYTYNTSNDPTQRYALKSITDPTGAGQFFEYDSSGRLSSSYLTGNVQRTNYTYAAGAVTTTDASGAASTIYFDDNGLVVRSVDPLGNYVNYQYNSLRQLISATDALGHTVTYTRCDCNRPKTITDQAGNTSTFTLGGAHNDPTALTDANGHVTHFSYDANGNLSSTTYADGSVEQAVYNALGDATSLINRRGQTVRLAYNAAGQVSQETFPDNTINSYTYDSRGRLATATDPDGTTTFTYDAADHLTRVDYPAGRFIQYTYDAAGRRTFMEDNTGLKIHYLYDQSGRLSELRDASGATETRIVLYTYDVTGRLAREDKGNGSSTVYTYDLAGQVKSIANLAPDNSINSQFTYTYDALGHRIGMGTTDGQWTFTYNLTGELTHAVFVSTNPAIANQDLSYAYDALGNRTQTTLNGVVTNYTSNNLNQYTSVGDTTNTYDADGNLISQNGPDGLRQFSYDALNRLVQVVTPDGTWQYEYDALGNRVAMIENGVETDYLIDPSNGQKDVIGAFDSDGNPTASYVYGFSLAAVMSGNNTGYYDFDSIGSTAGVSGSNGTYSGGGLTANYAYDPLGNLLSSTSSFTNPFQFVGGAGVLTQSNGLDLMQARAYDPSLGRFTAIDPLRMSGLDPNLYRYAANDPLGFIDPTGTKICWYGPWGENPVVNGGPNDFVGLSAGAGFGFSAGTSLSVGVGAVAGADVILGATPTGVVGAGAGAGAYVGVGPGASYGYYAGFGAGYSHGSHTGLILGWGDCPPDPKPPTPNPPNPGGNTGATGASGTVQSQDPNDLIGPAGTGPQNFVTSNSAFPYRIDFENASTASAPAQQVLITNQLDPHFDLSSFEFTDIGFGDTNLTIPAHSQHYEATVMLTENGTTFNVEIIADMNAATGLVSVTLVSVDPNTQLPPDVLTGFLPPEDGTGRGQGHVGYVVRPLASALPGTEIRNVALIQFDANTVIATNQIDEHDPSKGTDPTKEALVTLAAPNQTLRKNGANIELLDDSGQVLFAQPATSTAPIVVHGLVGQSSDFTIDYKFGGLFNVPGGLSYQGGNLGQDQIIVKGDANITLTNTTVTVSGPSKSISIKPITISGVNRATLIGGASKNTLTASSFSGAVTFDGGGGSDVLTGGAGNDTFILRAGTPTVNGNGGQDTVVAQATGTFTLSTSKVITSLGSAKLKGIEKAQLTGGAGADVFNVSGWAGNATLDGAGGTDKVLSSNDANFTLTDTSLVRSTGGTFTLANIESAELTGGKGNNTLDASAFSGFSYLNGSTGNDTLKSAKGGSVLLGGKGNDRLVGNIGRDVEFAGAGADTLDGGAGEDLLFAMPVTFEANRPEIDALFTAWNNPALDFTARVAQLRGGIANVPKIDTGIIHSEKLADTLTGGAGLDWFFANPTLDKINDLVNQSDVLTTI
ncbi:MAG: repeat protein, partial [Planctomycetaceae bacterium]|nr:repeat protein [Planctomycetaceae bacterium]